MKIDVFISYSHNDRHIADAICNRLEGCGIRCWYAPRNIQPGKEWAEAIIEALRESRIMVLVFTDSSNDSTQVKREVSTAVSSGVTIIPFKCTASEPTGSMQYYLSTLHWLDAMNESLERSIEKLKEECTRILGLYELQPPVPPVPPVKPVKKFSLKKIPPWVYIAAEAAVLAVVLCMILLPKRAQDKLSGGSEPPSKEVHALTVPSKTPEQKSEPLENETPDASPADSSNETDAPGAATPTPKITSEPVVPVEGGSYSDDPDMDSPGAEFYLYEVSEYYSDIYEKGVCLHKYFGDASDVIEIPKVVDGWPVTRIGEKCFEDMDTIQKVVLPDTIEDIGYRSFYGCTGLTDINLPVSLTSTGGWTFAHTGLTEFIAPESFTDLGYGTFYSCESLKNIVLTPAVSSIGADTFGYLAKGCTVTIPNPDVEVDIKAFREEEDVVIIAPEESYLKTYALAMHLTFQPME